MAIQLLRKPGDPVLPSFGQQLSSGVFGRGYRAATPAAAPSTTIAPTAPKPNAATVATAPKPNAATVATAPPAPMSTYTPPAKGTPRGSATFGGGLGKEVNINEWGAGLWGQGLDVNSPTLAKDVKSVIAAKSTAGGQYYDKDFVTRYPETAAKNKWDVSSDSGAIETLDWYYRDLSRRMRQSNSFLDSTIGKILTVGAQVGAAFIPGVGPAISAGIGAVTGGIKGGIQGAILGGISGYGIGKGVQFVQGGGLTSLFSKSAAVVDGTTAAATKAAGAASVSVPSTGAVTAAPSLLSKLGATVKGATSGVGDKLNTAATVVQAGLGVRDLLKGAAVAGGTALAANQLLPASTPPPPPVAAPPSQADVAAARSGEELQRERELRRRRATETNLTWGNTLSAPQVAKPSLWATPKSTTLGGGVRKAA